MRFRFEEVMRPEGMDFCLDQPWCKALPEDAPLFWRRHNGRKSLAMFSHFGMYTRRSMKRWMAIRGYSYDVVLKNGTFVTFHPREVSQ